MVGAVIHAASPVAVGGGGTRVDEADSALDGPLGEALGVPEVVFHQIARIGLSRCRAGAEVKNSADGVKTLGITLEAVQEVIRLDVVVEAKWGKIPPLCILSEHVGHEDILPTPFVQGMDEGAADKASSTGD